MMLQDIKILCYTIRKFCYITACGTVQIYISPYKNPNKTALDLFSSPKFNEPKS